VTDFLVKEFERILDYNFTAKVEQDFDESADISWTNDARVHDKFHQT
jgi:DNA topoisomerase-1